MSPADEPRPVLTADVESELEAPTRAFSGALGALVMVLTVGLSLYALYWVVGIVQPQIYRASFLLVVLILSFLLYPSTPSQRARVTVVDVLLILASVVALVWPIVDFETFIYRAASPLAIDVWLGWITIALVLEATRRSAGWILPLTAAGFIAYGYFGAVLDRIGLSLIAHRGYGVERLAGTLYMTLEGIFGVPLDVAATYIVLFSLYGAVLSASGAGKFFLDWSLAAVGRTRSGAGPGRTVTLAGILLGTVSGSGVANTVTLGAVAWPLLKRAGYSPETAGAILSAAGIGAILCPPALGAAAFIIAEFLHISYLQVIVMAIIPAALYFLSILLMIEADSRASGARPVHAEGPSVWSLTRHSGYHFLALIIIPAFLMLGMSAFRAVLWAMVLAVALSYLRRETRLSPARLLDVLDTGARSVLSVTATTATAGIIVGVVTLTGLGLKIAGLIIALAGGKLLLTVIYSALAVWMLGLAVPVTASYIIAAVMVAPALVKVGVPDVAAHMFIFYYAVLSEVSPPTALSPFAAAALTGGRAGPTMMLTWKYTLPAFLFPFAFTVTTPGLGILLQGSWADVAFSTVSATLGVMASAAGLGGWIRAKATVPERVLAVAGGVLLFFAVPAVAGAGLALFATAVAWHLGRLRRLPVRVGD